MGYFRQPNKRRFIVLSLLLSLLLLSMPGAKLHVHALDHEQGDHQNQSLVDTSGNTYLSKAHFSHDLSHEHDHGVISEVEVSNDVLLKNININALGLAISMLFFSLMICVRSRPFIQRRRENKLIFYSYYLLSPPLRAPPTA